MLQLQRQINNIWSSHLSLTQVLTLASVSFLIANLLVQPRFSIVLSRRSHSYIWENTIQHHSSTQRIKRSNFFPKELIRWAWRSLQRHNWLWRHSGNHHHHDDLPNHNDLDISPRCAAANTSLRGPVVTVSGPLAATWRWSRTVGVKDLIKMEEATKKTRTQPFLDHHYK